jgi:hypothetical protein
MAGALDYSPRVDASTPPPPPPPAYVLAANDIYPRGSREEELCDTASRPDWLYLGALLVLDVGSIAYTSNDAIKYDKTSLPLRLSGPALVGLTWGATIGGGYLALPKCSKHWVGDAPAEGDIRTSTPLAFALALLGAATAPIINGIAVGPNFPLEWSDTERAMHVVTAIGFGFVGALLPYLLPPKTWRAQKELERIRAGADAHGAYLRYTIAF